MRIEKCTPSTICDAYHQKSRDKICGLRWDTLAQIMSQASIYSGRKVLIFDGALGLVIGTAAYRMRGGGRILGLYTSQQPHFDLLKNLNLDKVYLNNIQVF